MNTLMLAQEGLTRLQKMQTGFYELGALVFLLVALLIAAAAVVGIFSLLLALFPAVTQRCSEALRDRHFLSFLAGIPLLGLLLVFGAVGKAVPPVGAVGVLTLGVFLLVGLTATSETLGRRLFWACGREGSRFAHVASGWGIFFLASWLPVVGWFLILPYGVLSGWGSLVVAAFRRRTAGKAAPQDDYSD